MSGPLQPGLNALRRRRQAIGLALAAPPLAALTWLAAQYASGAALLVATAGLLAFGLWLADDRRRHDLARYARALDAADPRLDDSSGLLLQVPDALSPLARLQQQRLQQRLAQHLPDLRPAWPRGALGASFVLAALLVSAGLWPPQAPPDSVSGTTASAAAAEPVRLVAQRLAVEPPRYTGLASSQSDTLDARVPEGSRLRWQLRFAPQPQAVRLRFHDGGTLELVRNGEDWQGEFVLQRAALYRLEIEAPTPLAEDLRYRLDLVADTPPQIRVEAPDKTLNLREPGQDGWDFAIRASDDYGLGEAQLEITLAQGSGENIAVKAQRQRLRGSGDARERQYRQRIDLAALGLAAGDEVIVRFEVTDRREPQAQRSRSASYILRLPPPVADDSVGMEGLVRRTLPAYFRSQRQLIIDTEALIAERPKLSADKFAERSDQLGVEQKILRLRYGQFLGEEFESGGRGGAAVPASQAGKDAAHSADADAKEGHAAHDGHAHAPATPAAAGFGDAGDVLAEFGHTHDHAEAATLLDPDTRRILKVALEAMWQSELELRSARPVSALPHEYKALEQIKLVQQASRIYLARVGLELPPVDESRRLSGERAGLRDGRNAALAATAADADLEAVWQALAAGTAPDWTRWDAWQQRRGLEAPDALDLAAAAEGLRRDAACSDCIRALRDRLWPLLPAAAAASAGRAAPDATGAAYLDALRAAERKP